MAGSGFITGPRGPTPMPYTGKPRSVPAKKASPPASLIYTQEELSRRAKGSKVLKRPGGGGPGNRA